MARARLGQSIKILVALLVVAVILVFGARIVTGKSIGLKSFVSSVFSSIQHFSLALLDSRRVQSYSHGRFTNIVFLHHSVGENLVQQGRIRQRFAQAGYNFWDQGYNADQLKNPDGSTTGYSYDVPDDNTDPDGLARIFAQLTFMFPLNTFSGLVQHEVIIFKSCFPANDIVDDAQLARYKMYYLSMRDVMNKHSNRIFIVLTPPPLNPAETNGSIAKRARAFANWLKSDEYLRGHSNIYTFDLFDQFAESNVAVPDYSMLRQAYRDGSDSHPNVKANETVAPVFVDFVLQSIANYKTGKGD